MDVDRAELNNLAAEQPDKLREMVNIWFSEAGRNGAFPLDDRTPVEILMSPDRSSPPLGTATSTSRHAPVRSGRRSTPRTARS